MSKGIATRNNLLTHARRLFWSRGYSNVSVRQIATSAGVDVALISRHFGGKLGLFEATLTNAFDLFETPPASDAELIEALVRMFADAPRPKTEPSPILMLQTNSHDEEVGAMVRSQYDEQIQKFLGQILGIERAALFAAAIFGFSVAEKSIQVEGIAEPGTKAYEAQLRHLLNAALDYRT